MRRYRCGQCGFETEAKFAPFACPQCQARGVLTAVSEASSSAPPPSVPVTPSAAPLPSPASLVVNAAPAAPRVVEVPPPAPTPVAPPLPTPEVVTTAIAPPEPVPPSAPAPPPKPMRPRSERLLWQYVSPFGAASPLRGRLVLDSQQRVVFCVHNQLVALAAQTGANEWEFLASQGVLHGPALGTDGRWRVHSSDGQVYFVDAAGNRVGERVEVGEPLGGAEPLVDAHNQTWICRAEGGLARIDNDGRLDPKPYYRTRRRFDCPGVIHHGTLYIGCEDHFVYAVPLGDNRGRNLWAETPGAGRTGGAISAALAIAPGPTIVAASHDDKLHAFALDGRSVATVPLPGRAIGAPVVSGGVVYLGVGRQPRNQPGRGALLAIDAETFQVRWSYATDAPIESTPVVGDDGAVYVGDDSGVIHAVSKQGQNLWRETFDEAVRSTGLRLGPDRIAFGLDDGRVVALRV